MRNSRMKAFNASRPAVNMRKSEELVELFLALPGIKKDAIDLNVEDGILLITTHEVEDSENYIRRGFDYSGMEWKFQLPAKTQLDDIEAGMDNGVLTVKLPQNIIKKEIQVA